LIAREVAAATGPGDVLFVGASNPIRDLDLTAGPFDSTARVLSNRGLAGIDGTVSSASGVALSGTAAGQVRCLVGDLTFLHDVGGLLVGPLEARVPLQIVVVDDDGGGIFSLLEHGAVAERGSRQSAMFERVFATPQRIDLGALCTGYGVEHQLVDDVAGLRKALADPPPGTSVIQVRVDRAAHRDVADRLRAAALQAVTPS
jgi:2-succinyl-5-enolpyruvyl-6-hydroxy-3-cyclohexene-1-carboxylate synthase